MKAFLSHSSKDKGFVESVASLLRPGSFELDSATFDAGILNSQAIIKSLQQCDLFCLFLSKNSAVAPYVNFEVLLGVEFFASGHIGRFLVICLDNDAFEQASTNVKFFNVVRKGLEVENTARLIQGYLISAADQRAKERHPFIGREDELIALEKQVTDHTRPASKALYISGNFGAGRRTIAQKFFENHFPNVSRNLPTIDVDQFAGLEELYRKVLINLRPAITASELTSRVQGFSIASPSEKSRLIAQLINSLLAANEAAILIDKGGVLTDEGCFTPEVNSVISNLEAKPHPPAIFISPRMMFYKLRRQENDVSYLSVASLRNDASERLISKLLKDRGILVGVHLSDLVKLGDGHPFNIYRMIEEISERGLEPFLANPGDFIDWKHRQSSEYIKKIQFTETEASILGILIQLPELDFEAIVGALDIKPDRASEDLYRLCNLHVTESSDGKFVISPPLRIAVERDKRFRLTPAKQQEAIKKLAASLLVRLEEGTAPLSLVDAAVLSSIEAGNLVSSLAAALLLPSHYVQLAKQHYDAHQWENSIRFSSEALKGKDRLSNAGRIAAYRFLCLAAARLGKAQLFENGIKELKLLAKDNWAKSNIAFLEGFNLRLKGSLPKAEEFFRLSYELSPGNVSAAREISAICLARDNLNEAEQYAREALSQARTNAYLLDTLIAVLIRKHGRKATQLSEIDELFDILEKAEEEEGRSFFTTRKAEFEHLWGDNKEALRLISEAMDKTPTIFEPKRLYAEILLKDGNKAKALEAVSELRRMVTSRDPIERRTNYRLYLKTHSHYFLEVGRWEEAKELYKDSTFFTDEERDAAIREIEIVQGFKSNGEEKRLSNATD